jgi:hypothetical protein
MPECRTVRHLISPVPEWTKKPVLEPVRYRDKRTQSGTGQRYRMPECRCPAIWSFDIYLESRTCWRSVLRRRRQSRRPKYQRAIYFFFHSHLIGVGLTNVPPRQQWSCRYGSTVQPCPPGSWCGFATTAMWFPGKSVKKVTYDLPINPPTMNLKSLICVCTYLHIC